MHFMDSKCWRGFGLAAEPAVADALGGRAPMQVFVGLAGIF